MLVIRNADVWAPEHLGRKDLLIEGGVIRRIADHIPEYDEICDAEVIDLQGKRLVPGYIDIHEHITGGGGENGPATRCPEASAGKLFRCGVTTAVGLLGTDGITRSIPNLLAKCRALNEEGMTCYILTGSYGYPPVTVTESVESDIVLIDRIIGVKTAMSDHRSSDIDAEGLIDLATQARRGGMLAGCAGYVTIHCGSGHKTLQPLFEAVSRSDIPVTKLLPTHIGRTEELFQDGLKFAAMGGYIDITAGCTDEERHATAEKMKRYIDADPQNTQMTLSSDSFGSMPKFNEKMECIGLTYATPDGLHEEIRILVEEMGVPLDTALRFLTVNPASLLCLKDTKGQIAEGYDADLIVYDDEMRIDSVFAKGRKAVYEKEVLMKSTFED